MTTITTAASDTLVETLCCTTQQNAHAPRRRGPEDSWRDERTRARRQTEQRPLPIIVRTSHVKRFGNVRRRTPAVADIRNSCSRMCGRLYLQTQSS